MDGDDTEVAAGVLVEFYVHQTRGATQYMKRSLARVYLPASEARDFESTRGAPVMLPPALRAAAAAGLRVQTADAFSSVRMAIGMIKTHRRIGMVQQTRNGGEAWLRRAVVAPDLRLEALQCLVCEAAIFDGHYACWQHREQCTICVRCWSDHHWGSIPPARAGASAPRGARPRVSLHDPSSAAAEAGAAHLAHSLFENADGATGPLSSSEVVHRQQHFAYSRRWTNDDLAAITDALRSALAVSQPSAPPLGRKRAAPDGASTGVALSAALSAAQQHTQSMHAVAQHLRSQRQTHRPRRVSQSLDLTPSELPLQRESSEAAAGSMTGAKILNAVFEAFGDLSTRAVHSTSRRAAGALDESAGASAGVAVAALGADGGGAEGAAAQSPASATSLGSVLRAVFNPREQPSPPSTRQLFVAVPLPPLTATTTGRERWLRRILAPSLLDEVRWRRTSGKGSPRSPRHQRRSAARKVDGLQIIVAPCSGPSNPGRLPLHIAPLTTTYSVVCAANVTAREMLARGGEAVAEWTVYHPLDCSAVVELLFERMVRLRSTRLSLRASPVASLRICCHPPTPTLSRVLLRPPCVLRVRTPRSR
jgi:hypothetical protein